MRFLIMVIGLMAMALPAVAGPRVNAFQNALPEATLKDLNTAPDVFMEHMAGLILGYGGPKGLNADGIMNYLAVNTAYMRAREMRRFLVADLNNDASVSLAEMNILIQTENARMRGRLLVGFHKADRDTDAIVTMQEARLFAQTRALEAMTARDENLLEALVTLDLDGDGYLALDEIIEIVSVFQEQV